ncbi:hypothetical protein HOA91_05270 [Candidatus Woesearchaeota archaeon]|jgi:hypothetical protein|nr:hypothetical protein [Candidatus Woesearchaeota archaeon]
MTDKLEKLVKKESSLLPYAAEVAVGGVVIFAKQIFDFQGEYALVAETITLLGGMMMVMDGCRRMQNVVTDYQMVIRNYLNSPQNGEKIYKD